MRYLGDTAAILLILIALGGGLYWAATQSQVGTTIAVEEARYQLNLTWRQSLVDSGHATWTVDRRGKVGWELYPTVVSVQNEKDYVLWLGDDDATTPSTSSQEGTNGKVWSGLTKETIASSEIPSVEYEQGSEP